MVEKFYREKLNIFDNDENLIATIDKIENGIAYVRFLKEHLIPEIVYFIKSDFGVRVKSINEKKPYSGLILYYNTIFDRDNNIIADLDAISDSYIRFIIYDNSYRDKVIDLIEIVYGNYRQIELVKE